MLLSVFAQLQALGATLLVGAAILLAWDVYRMAKAILGIRQSLLIALCDLAFWVVMGPLSFVLLLLGNGAELRLFVPIGLFLGAAVYGWLLRPIVRYVLWSAAALLAALGHQLAALRWWFGVRPAGWLSRRMRPWGMP